LGEDVQLPLRLHSVAVASASCAVRDKTMTSIAAM
jgi:hypothetical protein